MANKASDTMITGFTISSVEGKITSTESLAKQRFPKLNISLDTVNVDGTKVKIGYTFLADYHEGDAKDAKNVGTLKLGGTVELTDSKDKVSAIMKSWNDKKTLPVDVAEEIINGLNFRCSATGTLVAYALGLIPPLVISTTKIQEG
ncbi:MAG: hypothetical protein M1504_04055 [Candidatus Marsarchaeota archaeon]|nr:hypothetical protein [Candidatus Marsarchaeota archaeon]